MKFKLFHIYREHSYCDDFEIDNSLNFYFI